MRAEILGIPVDVVDMQSAIAQVRKMLNENSNHLVLAANPEKVMAAQRDPELLKALASAALVIPDGIGVVLAARILRKGRMQRVAGADLMPEICRLAAQEKKRVFLFGAKPEVAKKAAILLQERYPELCIAGTHHGYVSNDEMPKLIDKINSTRSDILFVGLGSPRQERWLCHNLDRLDVRVCQGVGGTFDAICGEIKRAPKIFQRLNLEWLYRLFTQPQRLHRQMALPNFAFQVLVQAISGK